MCFECRPLIKAIDAYIEKADSDLSDTLEDEGYAKGKGTVKYIEEIEEEVAEALLSQTDYFLEAAEKAVDLEEFAKSIWPGIKLNDELEEKLATIFAELLGKFMPEYVEIYIQQTDPELTAQRLSKRATAWVKSWSKDLGKIMQLNSHKEIESILETGLKEGSSIATFTRNILDSGIRDEYHKARRVAITEVLTAHRAAQQEAFMPL